MTCIIGLEHDGKVFMGGDSAAIGGWNLRRVSIWKIFKKSVLNDHGSETMMIGYTTSFRMGQILQYDLEPPDHKDGMDDVEYLITQLVPAVRACLKHGGYTEIKDNREHSGVFLVGYCGHLYKVDEDFQVFGNNDGMEAVGCGAEYALGALEALNPHPYPRPGDDQVIEQKILRALEISSRFCAGVHPPFYVMKNDSSC